MKKKIYTYLDAVGEVGDSTDVRLGLSVSRKKWLQRKMGIKNYKERDGCGLCFTSINKKILDLYHSHTMCHYCEFADFLKSKGFRSGRKFRICVAGGRDNPKTMLELFDEFEEWLDAKERKDNIKE